MKVSAYLSFNGQCEAAFKFYEHCLGGKIKAMMTHGESPEAEQVPDEWHPKIMHAHLMVGGQEFMGCDAPPGHYETPQGFSVCLQFNDSTKAEHVFHALAENGKVQMLLQETFWATRFGMLIDQFGTPWMINCEATA